MKKLLLLFALLPVLLMSCSDNKEDDPTPPPPEETVELPFNEPLIMYGCSVAEVREAETREEIEYGDYEEIYEYLTYKETKYGLEYLIQYTFQNDILFLLQVKLEGEYSFDFFDEILFSLAEKYVASDYNLTFHSNDFFIMSYFYSDIIFFRYHSKGHIEGLIPIV